MEPKNGDFAALLEGQATSGKQARPFLTEDEQIEEAIVSAVMTPEEEEAGLQAAMQEISANQAALAANPLTDEELERQALEAGGDDNDPNTPE